MHVPHSRKIRTPWRPDEDKLLSDVVGAHGARKWGRIAQMVPNRTAKQCRERWNNHINPSVLKGPWTKEEDRIILSWISKVGCKWAHISKYLPGRTDSAVANRYHQSLKRRLASDEQLASLVLAMKDAEPIPDMHLHTKAKTTPTNEDSSESEDDDDDDDDDEPMQPIKKIVIRPPTQPGIRSHPDIRSVPISPDLACLPVSSSMDSGGGVLPSFSAFVQTALCGGASKAAPTVPPSPLAKSLPPLPAWYHAEVKTRGLETIKPLAASVPESPVLNQLSPMTSQLSPVLHQLPVSYPY